jgi:DNA modification methylase
MDNGQLDKLLPTKLRKAKFTQELVPSVAKNKKQVTELEAAAKSIPTQHDVYPTDARNAHFLEPNSVHLVLTSPPYWTLKRYEDDAGQLGHVDDYEVFHRGLDEVWRHCFRALVPGGRLVCVIGDVCLSRRKNAGVHTVIPLHATIQEHCRAIGFMNLALIIWNKIANAVYEAEGNGAGFLGKPYEPNAVIKNDIEYILMLRKPGGYRQPTQAERLVR